MMPKNKKKLMPQLRILMIFNGICRMNARTQARSDKGRSVREIPFCDVLAEGRGEPARITAGECGWKHTWLDGTTGGFLQGEEEEHFAVLSRPSGSFGLILQHSSLQVKDNKQFPQSTQN
jgi:hypothetical protein